MQPSALKMGYFSTQCSCANRPSPALLEMNENDSQAAWLIGDDFDTSPLFSLSGREGVGGELGFKKRTVHFARPSAASRSPRLATLASLSSPSASVAFPARIAG